MKILLIFPPQNLEERYAHDVGDVGGFLRPLGLLYMAATLEREGHYVQVMDCPTYGYGINHIEEKLSDFNPAIVGIGTITSLAQVTKVICDMVRERCPEATIMLGGPHATIMPKEVAEEMEVDIVLVEEADNRIVEIVNDLERFKKERIVDCGKVKDLNTLPMPARHLLDMRKYTALPNAYKVTPHIAHMVTSRGCPFTCTFCFDAMGTFRQRSVENVIREIQLLKNLYNIKEVAFWDDILTPNKKWMKEFCEAIKKEKIVWSCYTRLNLVNPEMLKDMKESGCWNIFYGIEAGDNELLKHMRKMMNVDQMKQAVRWTQEAGIEIRGSFMVGLPGETPALARKTIDFAIDLDPDYAQFSITTPYPGTQLWNDYEKWGTLDKTFQSYHGWSPVFVPHGYKNKEELMAIHKEAFRRFYLRPTYVWKRLKNINSWLDIKRYWHGFKVVLGMLKKEKMSGA